jgi:hypothetical protein
MTGIVNGRVEVYKDGSVDVVPEPCPVEGRHPGEGQRCYHVLRTGERRACLYWSALASAGTRHERMDVTMIVLEATARSARTISCQVLCQRQKANRPPGC